LQTVNTQPSKQLYTNRLNLNLQNKKKIFFYIYTGFITADDVMKPVIYKYPDKNENKKISNNLLTQKHKFTKNIYHIIKRLRYLLFRRPRDHPLIHYD
jgi:hypothetical protein